MDAKAILRKYEDDWKALQAADASAKAEGKLVGRYIAHAYADGNAIYLITRVTTRTATIEAVPIGDAWVLPAWGAQATIPLATAQDFIRRRDGIARLFGGWPVTSPEINWDDPAARLRLIETVGHEAYNKALQAHFDRRPDIYPVPTRFGTLYAVKGTPNAFSTRAQAEQFLRGAGGADGAQR